MSIRKTFIAAAALVPTLAIIAPNVATGSGLTSLIAVSQSALINPGHAPRKDLATLEGEFSCIISDRGRLSEFGMFCGDGKGRSAFIHYKRKQPGAMFEIKDSSLRNPWGGRNSVPNTLHRQFIKKPLKWLGIN